MENGTMQMELDVLSSFRVADGKVHRSVSGMSGIVCRLGRIPRPKEKGEQDATHDIRAFAGVGRRSTSTRTGPAPK
jgi:hypothetical protein